MRIDVPAGRHPVVLTFDDSTPGHFGLDPQGNPKPDTAVGVIEQVARENPGFRPTATFYLNKDLFGMSGVQAAAGPDAAPPAAAFGDVAELLGDEQGIESEVERKVLRELSAGLSDACRSVLSAGRCQAVIGKNGKGGLYRVLVAVSAPPEGRLAKAVAAIPLPAEQRPPCLRRERLGDIVWRDRALRAAGGGLAQDFRGDGVLAGGGPARHGGAP